MPNLLQSNQNKKDPSLAPTMCELCGKVQELRFCHSIGVVYMMPGHDAENKISYGSYQCPDTQHFACSHQHAMILSLCCLYEHIHTGNHKEQGKELEHPTLLSIKQSLDDMVNDLVKSGQVTLQEKEEAIDNS